MEFRVADPPKAGCLSDLCLRALRVLRGSNLAFLCALRVSVVGKRIFSTLASTVCGVKGIRELYGDGSK